MGFNLVWGLVVRHKGSLDDVSGLSVFDLTGGSDLLTSHSFRSRICALVLEGWWHSYGCGKLGL